MPHLHPREKIVRRARADLSDKTLEWLRSDAVQELTDGEYIALVAAAFSEMVEVHAKMMVRVERHGTTDRPGGLE
jgi:hypothetical protein